MPYLQSSSPDAAGDVELFFSGDRFPVVTGPVLRRNGWRGGTFVMFVSGSQDFTVEISDGSSTCGFLLFQSEDYDLTPPLGTGPGSPENYIAKQFRNPTGGNNVATIISNGTRAYFKVYETVALTPLGTRTGGPITYALNDRLRVSENGLLCNDSENDLIAAGVTTPVTVGIVSAVPSDSNNNRLCMDMGCPI